jgi:hypothetical protein
MGRTALIIALGLWTVSLEAAPPGSGRLRGTPGSVTSMRPDGSLRGVPGSVTDPRPRSSVPHHSGNPRNRDRDHDRNGRFGYPYYGYPYFYDGDDGDYADYGQQVQQPEPAQPQVSVSPEDNSQPHDSYRAPQGQLQSAVEPTPKTTFVFRDGHKTEIQNYAIMGGNLFDLTNSAVMKKIPLALLDLDATRRANEANGVDFPTI